MFFVLYKAGKGLRKNGGKILSRPGLAAIMAYTINEGLRFGRGIDYNSYWGMYEEVSKGIEQNRDASFVFLVKLFVSLGIPYQGLVILESLMFIIGTLFLIRNFREILPLLLPLYTFLSYLSMENMIRWYLGFSFLMIGLSFLLNKKYKKYILFSLIGCLFHIGLLPVVALMLIFYFFKMPLMHPFLSIGSFIAIAALFNTELMLNLTEAFNLITSISERGEMYQKSAEKWLTGGYAGIYKSPFPSNREMLFFFLIVWGGYKIVKESNHNYIFTYNLFLFGFLLKPIANQIELLNRYHTVFFFFISIVIALMIFNYKYQRKIQFIITNIVIFLLLWNIYGTFKGAFVNPQLHMYVWDHGNEKWDTQLQRWLDVQEKNADALEKKDNKRR